MRLNIPFLYDLVILHYKEFINTIISILFIIVCLLEQKKDFFCWFLTTSSEEKQRFGFDKISLMFLFPSDVLS